MEKMLNSSKQGALAVRQAEEISHVFCSCVDAFQLLKRKQTKKGELRLDNCRKYDLGGGYRLITIQDKDHLFLAYAGTHDECHLWLERHKGTTLNTSSLVNSSNILPITFPQPQAVETAPVSDFTKEPASPEDEILSTIDDKTLRSVFSGICQPK